MDILFKDNLEFARELDSRDEIFHIRERFYLQEGQIYMDGNSLGVCSKDAEEYVLNMLETWKKEGINIWGVEEGKYFLYQNYLGKLTAPLIGADPEEVTVGNSTTVNIHQCIATFYKPTTERYKIIVDDLNFPTDRYAIDSQVKLKGYEIEEAVKVLHSRDGRLIAENDVIEAMSDDVAIIFLPSVYYRSAQLLDMERITREAQKRGILMGWDLAHSIGSVPHDLKTLDCDFAVWCNYKYLAGGPGATAGMYINKKHFLMEPGLAGWHGNKKKTQFLLKQNFEHETNAGGWQIGTQPLLSMAPIEGVLKLYNEAGMDKIRKKSLLLTEYLMFLIDERLQKYGCQVGTPREDFRRGGHVALEHDEAYRICAALKEHNVIPDFREPNIVRLAPVALYVSFAEIYRLVDILESILINREYEKFSHQRTLVV